jgi:hypothetical protein
MIVERKMRFGQGGRGRKRKREVDGSETPRGRVPRVAKLMALAIRFDQLIRDGVVADQAELARVGHVSRARLTQIMNLLSLAPDIQEDLLMLPMLKSGRNKFTEKQLRTIGSVLDWKSQRQMWKQ